MKIGRLIVLKTEKRAVITVEASLIMPLILASIILIIFLSFYGHDRCLFLKAAFTSALRGEREEESSEAYNKAVKEIGEISGKMTGLWALEKDIKVSDEEIQIDLTGEMKLSGGILRLIFGKDSLKLSIKAAGERERASDHIRTLRKWGIGYCY